MNEAVFDGTAELHNDLEQNLGNATARSLEDGLEQQPVRVTLLPSFLLAEREVPDVNPELEEMQRLKEAAPEHVRWRSHAPCSPSEFRQALPANGADGEAPLKVVGLRGARAARAKKRTCFGRRRGAKNEETIIRDRGDGVGSCSWNSE